MGTRDAVTYPQILMCANTVYMVSTLFVTLSHNTTVSFLDDAFPHSTVHNAQTADTNKIAEITNNTISFLLNLLMINFELFDNKHY